jgi:hypothetical protein
MSLPCLVIAYGRRENVVDLIVDLLGQGVTKIYVAIDGPKTQAVDEIQHQLLAEIKQLESRFDAKFEIWQRNCNLGVAKSVITALDWFFSHELFGVIIEDDLSISQDFIKFVSQNSEKVCPNLMMVSGNRFFDTPRTSLYSHYPATWGWATWRENWLNARHQIINRPHFRISKAFQPGYLFWLLGSLRVFNLKVDTWDLPLAHYMQNHSKVTLLPPVNLVSNVGADSFASHTFDRSFPLGVPTQLLENYKFDESPMESVDYDKRLRLLVFKIKPKHYFLFLHVLQETILSLYKRNTLLTEIEKIALPN